MTHKTSEMVFYQIQGGKTVKDVQFDPQTLEIWSTDVNVPLSMISSKKFSIFLAFDNYFLVAKLLYKSKCPSVCMSVRQV